MNVVCLLGRLTADPELRHTQTQTPVTSFSVAVDRAYQPKGAEQRQADFINCVAWRQTAEFICRYFHKGQRTMSGMPSGGMTICPLFRKAGCLRSRRTKHSSSRCCPLS